MSRMKVEGRSRQVLLLLASTFLGALLNFLASVVNTHCLEPSEYGDVRYVQNLVQLIAWILLFGYFQSGSRLLALSEDTLRRRRLRGCLITILLVTVAILALTTAGASLFYPARPNVAKLFLVTAPVAMYPLLANYMNYVAQGDNFIGRLSLARFLPALLYVPIAWLLFSRIKATSQSMMLLQWGLYSLVLIVIIASTRPSFRGLKPVFADIQSENRSYGLKLYVGSLAMTATTYIAGITLGYINPDNTEVAYYTLALTLTTPLSYLPGIVGTTYFRQFASQRAIPAKVFMVTVALTLFSCLAYIVVIHPLVHWLYPAQYSSVAVFASWLSVGFCVHGLGDMLNRFLGSHGQGIAIRNSSFACGAVKAPGFIVLVWLMGINGAIITHVVGSMVYAASLYVYYRRFVNGKGEHMKA